MEFTGKVIKILPRHEVDGKNGPLAKGALIIEEEKGRFKNSMAVTFLGDSVDDLDNVKLWDVITVGYDSRGKEHEGAFYTNLNWYEINPVK